MHFLGPHGFCCHCFMHHIFFAMHTSGLHTSEFERHLSCHYLNTECAPTRRRRRMLSSALGAATFFGIVFCQYLFYALISHLASLHRSYSGLRAQHDAISCQDCKK